MSRTITMKERLSFVIEGNNTIRYHTRPGLRPNTIGHHSNNVVLLTYLITDGQASAKLLMAAATHDLGEQVVCDVSSPAKRLLAIQALLKEAEQKVLASHGFLFELTADEQFMLGVADLFELLMYCCDEIALGNKYVNLIAQRSVDYIKSELSKDVRFTSTMYNVYINLIEIYLENKDDDPKFDVFYR